MSGAGHMAQIGEALQKAARHRKFHWCRRQNGFSDMPLWRVLAAELDMPLYQVLAFVNRMEEFANAADQRGHVGGFSAAEFGAALGMPANDAARIFAALERPDIGWIAYDHVSTFYDRNPDRIDETASQRKRDQRSRERGMKEIARKARIGEISEEERRRLELELLVDPRLSTTLTRHNVTPRDIVTVTPEQSKNINSAAVDNTEASAAAGSEGLAEEQLATAWIDTDGRKMLVEYLQIVPTLAETYIERWRRDLQDDVALATIIQGAEGAGYIGARFHTIITDQIKRFIAKRSNGPSLPLLPPRPGQRTSGHNVTSGPVDNVKRSAS